MSGSSLEERVAQLEAENVQLKKDLVALGGETIFSSLLLPTVITFLKTTKLMTEEQFAAIVDATLLVFEGMRAELPERGQASVDHARSRLEYLLDRNLKTRP